jgi:ABC-type Mn2+/Zn2+ transport system permease subunit
VTLARRISIRLLLGWLISLAGGIAGLFISFWGDFPSGAAIVCTFGALLILAALGTLLKSRACQ